MVGRDERQSVEADRDSGGRRGGAQGGDVAWSGDERDGGVRELTGEEAGDGEEACVVALTREGEENDVFGCRGRHEWNADEATELR